MIIPEKTFFWIELLEVPTPPFESTVDFNQIIIQVFNLTNFEILARNFYLTNRMVPANFNKLQNVLKVNNDSVIQMTKGTYTIPISIKTHDNTRFITNLEINAFSDGFTFLDPRMLIYLGAFNTTFRIGAHENLQEKAYSFNIDMEEKHFKTYYAIANQYIIFVTSIPVTISVQQLFSVPRRGCSLPVKISVENTPYTDMEIAVQYEYWKYPETYFVLDLELSSYLLSYSPTTTYRYLSFCTTSQLPDSMTHLNMHLQLAGTNQYSYRL